MENRNDKRNKLSQAKKLTIFKTLFENAAFSGFEIVDKLDENKIPTGFDLKIKHVDIDDVIQISQAVGLSFFIQSMDYNDDFVQVFKVYVD